MAYWDEGTPEQAERAQKIAEQWLSEKIDPPVAICAATTLLTHLLAHEVAPEYQHRLLVAIVKMLVSVLDPEGGIDPD